MARPRRQEARRRDLVDVVAKLLVTEGSAGARLTDVARAAGLTPASVSYYYPTIFDLYVAAFAVVTQQFVLDRQRAVEQFEDPEAKLVECVRLGVPTPGTASHSAAVLLGELSSLANRREEIRESALLFETGQVELFAQILGDGISKGRFELRYSLADTARMLLAGEDGLATAVIAGRMTATESLHLLLLNASMLTACDLTGHNIGRSPR